MGSALVTAKGVILRDFHESDPHAVGIFDPHLDQSPGLSPGRLQDRHAGGRKAIVFSGDVPYLQP